MKKEYINPSVRIKNVHIPCLTETSVPFSGSTDDTKPNETKRYIDCILFDNEE